MIRWTSNLVISCIFLVLLAVVIQPVPWTSAAKFIQYLCICMAWAAAYDVWTWPRRRRKS